MADNHGFKTVIDAKHRLFDLHLRETLQYHNLILQNVKRTFTAKYKQTVLGPAWAVIQPLFSTIVFNVIFGKLAKLTTADIPGDYVVPNFLFYMAGNICWIYFSGTFTTISHTFLANRHTMGKVYYPRLVAPISTALTQLISFGIQFVMLLIIWAYFLIKGGTSIRISPMLLMVPVLILQMMLLAIGLGIIVSSLTTKYRDLAMLVGFGVNLWHYATPVTYGLELASAKYRIIYMLNPMTSVVTTFRYSLFGFGYFNIGNYLYSWAFSIIVFFIGLVLFSRIERNFMDTI